MTEVSVDIAGGAPLVCVPATWGDVLYLGGTGRQGAPTREQMARRIDDHAASTTDRREPGAVDWPTTVTSAREERPPDDDHDVALVQPADWVKPVELIELLQRRTANRKQAEAPTSSPFYDAEFVARHRKSKRRSPD